MERLKASLEKGQLLCGLGSGALCVACFWVALFASNIRKGHAYAIFVTKSSADALRTRSCIHQCDQIMIALYAQTVNILAVTVSLNA